MDIWQSIILGIVEGLTEFLPVSSTGHLILTAKLLEIPQTEFLKTFEISIQLGAILAVVALYWRKLFLEWETMKRIIVALVPALGIGYLFYASIRKMLESDTVVVYALFIGGVILILFEWFRKGKDGSLENIEILPYRTVFSIGFFQALAVIPGVSRSGSTILGGLLFNLKRKTIVEFSFLLGVPTMVAATTLDLYANASLFSLNDTAVLLVGFVTAFLVAMLAIKFFLRFVESHTFIAFGIYRILIAGFFWVFIL